MRYCFVIVIIIFTFNLVAYSQVDENPVRTSMTETRLLSSALFFSIDWGGSSELDEFGVIGAVGAVVGWESKSFFVEMRSLYWYPYFSLGFRF